MRLCNNGTLEKIVSKNVIIMLYGRVVLFFNYYYCLFSINMFTLRAYVCMLEYVCTRARLYKMWEKILLYCITFYTMIFLFSFVLYLKKKNEFVHNNYEYTALY